MVYHQDTSPVLGDPFRYFIICKTAGEYAKVLKKIEDSPYYETDWSRMMRHWEKYGYTNREFVETDTLVGRTHVAVVISFGQFTKELKQEVDNYFTGYDPETVMP